MPDDNNNKGNFNFSKNNRIALIFLVSAVALFLFIFSLANSGQASTIPYSQFIYYLNNGLITEVKIFDNNEIKGQLQDPSGTGRPMYFKTMIPYHDAQLMELLAEHEVITSGGNKSSTLGSILIQVIPWLITFAFILWIFRSVQGGSNKAFSFGKSRAKRYDGAKEKITFSDVAGQEEPKYELMEVVEFLKDPEKFTSIGARIPKGVLLVGNPGTGKTLLAKAVAGEAGVPFFHMSGSDFVEMFVGVGASRVRDLFEQGRKNAPCILFVDEIDAVGRTRGAGYGGGHDEREQTLNQLLVEMDGFDTKTGVIIIAATNRPDVLDPALLRPGRFDRQVVVDMPDVKEREAILKIHSRKVKLDKSVDLSVIARATPGTSGADIANIVNEAALFAARSGRQKVVMDDFEEARDKILMGVARKSRVFTDKEKMMTSYHEAGHALLHYYLDNLDPLHKVTVVPRGRALGVTFSLPEEDSYSKSRSWLVDKIKECYGGYAAEKLIYNDTTNGAQQDIKTATNIARKMICEWGMNDSLGPVAFGSGDEPIFIGKEIAQHKDYSDNTADMIDQEIRKVLTNSLKDVENILKKHKGELDLLAKTLFEKETLEDSAVRKLLGIKKKKNEKTDSTAEEKNISETE
jgi:cell division protease FtsH